MKHLKFNSGLRFSAACMLFGMLGVGTTCRTVPDHSGFFDRHDLLISSAEDLAATGVYPSLDAPLEVGKNILWCGTFQLAWNEGCSLVGEDLAFEHSSPVVDSLNKKSFVKQDLDEASYVALAGFVRDGIRGKIQAALDSRFKGAASPRLIPSIVDAPRPQDIIAYSYLFKKLEFPVAFERLDSPLLFGGQKTASFGMGEYKPGHFEMYPQVNILDYKSDQDFVVELKTKSQGDRLILAKIAPEKTLASTVAVVEGRVGTSLGGPATPGDVLRIPRMNFDISRRYTELEGNRLVTSNSKVAQDLYIGSAFQGTRFQMDEKGVILQSEVHITFACASNYVPQPRHIMVFDQPFLILMKRTDAKMPYFALWVDNPELLCPWQ